MKLPIQCKYVLSSALAGLSVCLMATPASAQGADRTAEYTQLLAEIQSAKLNLVQKNAYVETQKAEIASLQSQLKGVKGVIASVDPMLKKMVDSIGSEIDQDLPFNPIERYERLAKLQEVVADSSSRPGDKMRWALRTYEEEAVYGQTVAAYAGGHPVEAERGKRLEACVADYLSGMCAMSKEQIKRIEGLGVTTDDMGVYLRDSGMDVLLKDGDYLRYGRLALSFMTADESNVYRYDAPSKSWEKLSGGQALDVVRTVRAAKGEAAPGVIKVPVYMDN